MIYKCSHTRPLLGGAPRPWDSSVVLKFQAADQAPFRHLENRSHFAIGPERGDSEHRNASRNPRFQVNSPPGAGRGGVIQRDLSNSSHFLPGLSVPSLVPHPLLEEPI